MNKILFSVGAVILLVVGYGVYNDVNVKKVGSVSRNSGYISTSTSPTSGVGSFSATGNGAYKVLFVGPGEIGNITITLGSNAPLRAYDASSTVTNTEWATTTIVDFKTTGTPGTYVVDAIVQKGLLIDTSSSVGIASTTISYRQY